MQTFLQGFLDNDSAFGRLMNKIGIIVGANLMFVVFSIPVFTIGAGFVALYHVMLKTLRGDGNINPFKQFWLGFKSNFKQATICWIIAVVLVIIGYVDYSICRQAGGFLGILVYGLYAFAFVGAVIFLYLLPVMAAFADTIPHLMRNAIFFAVKKPFKLIVILFFDIFPFVLTYSDPHFLPLYAFCWFFFGFGALAMLGSALLVKEFAPYLPAVDAEGDFIASDAEDEGKMLEDLKMLDGL